MLSLFTRSSRYVHKTCLPILYSPGPYRTQVEAPEPTPHSLPSHVYAPYGGPRPLAARGCLVPHIAHCLTSRNLASHHRSFEARYPLSLRVLSHALNLHASSCPIVIQTRGGPVQCRQRGLRQRQSQLLRRRRGQGMGMAWVSEMSSVRMKCSLGLSSTLRLRRDL